MPVDLTREQCATIAARILADIDRHCQVKYNDGHRKHLGASMLGEECERKLWYTFRWVKNTVHSGRMYRLFNRGHKEEERIIEWLRGVGFIVKEYEDETNKKQFRVAFAGKHGGGSMDGQCAFPMGYGDLPIMLLEFKTQGTGAGFNNLVKNGVKAEKPRHYAQMSIYGKHYGFKYALYIVVNKNDDSMYIEIVELDWKLGEQLEIRAEKIIRSELPPPRINENSAYYECKICDFRGVCHLNESYEKNCRSCDNAVAVPDGKWFCKRWNNIIPEDFIKQGCDVWKECK